MSETTATARRILAALEQRVEIDYSGLFEAEVLDIIEKALTEAENE
jgi:hypothetical protein